MNFNFPGLLMFFGGIILMYSAIHNQSPRDVIRNGVKAARDPKATQGMGKNPETPLDNGPKSGAPQQSKPIRTPGVPAVST